LFGTVVYGFCLIAFYLSYGEVQIILKLVNDGLGGIATMGSSWSPPYRVTNCVDQACSIMS